MQQARIRAVLLQDMNRTHPPSIRRKVTYTDGGNADIASLHGCNLIRVTHMYRTYGQIFAPALSALPPSVVVVLG